MESFKRRFPTHFNNMCAKSVNKRQPGAGSNSASFVYVDDAISGIRRRKCGIGFVYRAPDGMLLRDEQELQRIAALAIPPAYSDVWICPLAQGHLQATARDSRGRKQYRYHVAWREVREAQKFNHLLAFGLALPRIRKRVREDIRRMDSTGAARRAVMAGLVRLLDATLIRVGNVEYARENGSFSLTTLRNRHAMTRGHRVVLNFRGKSGVIHEVDLDDPLVAKVVRRCQALPGQELFRYVDDSGELSGVSSTDVNNYLREVSGVSLTAKEFRTWHASVLALSLLRDDPSINAQQVFLAVATKLRNTVAVCRKSYIHPRVLGATAPELLDLVPKRRRALSTDECALIDLLIKKHREPGCGGQSGNAGRLATSISGRV